MASKSARSARFRRFGPLTAAAAAVLGPAAGAATMPSTPLPATTTAVAASPQTWEFSFRYEGILGTSLDLIVRASIPPDARACAHAALSEIERLRGILSTRDPASQI